jgi:hypothetical protein
MLPFTAPCSDEPRMTNVAAMSLTMMWQYGIDARENVAALHFINAGDSKAESVCYTAIKDATRGRLAQHFYNSTVGLSIPRTDGGNDVQGFWSSVRHSQYFSQIDSLWRSAFRELGMTYPPISQALYRWENGYLAGAVSGHEHIASGVQCQEVAIYNKMR